MPLTNRPLLILAVVALSAALAAGLEDSMKTTVLPLGRRSRGRQAVEGSLFQQLQQVRKEPGVRQQLSFEGAACSARPLSRT